MIFSNPQYQASLKENGYLVIPFLTEREVKALNNFYDTMHKDGEPPLFIEEIHMTTWCKEADYKQKVSEELMQLFDAASKRFFSNFRRLNNVFIIKRSGKDTTFKVHQDWNVIDESKYESVNVWVPLHDVDENSGALWILKGSHKINRKVRGAGYLFPDYGEFTEELKKKAVSVKLKAGEAIVFYHSVIHGSPPNLSGKLRKAACFTVIPKEAPLCIYFQNSKEAPLEQHEPLDDFIFKYEALRTETFTKPPTQKAIKVLPPYRNEKVMMKELEVFLNPKKEWWNFWK